MNEQQALPQGLLLIALSLQLAWGSKPTPFFVVAV
jgi:hypothetical protein